MCLNFIRRFYRNVRRECQMDPSFRSIMLCYSFGCAASFVILGLFTMYLKSLSKDLFRKSINVIIFAFGSAFCGIVFFIKILRELYRIFKYTFSRVTPVQQLRSPEPRKSIGVDTPAIEIRPTQPQPTTTYWWQPFIRIGTGEGAAIHGLSPRPVILTPESLKERPHNPPPPKAVLRRSERLSNRRVTLSPRPNSPEIDDQHVYVSHM